MKKLTDYQAIIVDMDGTLYYQQPVRMAMLVEMLLHFWRLPEFVIVQKYRSLYENGLSYQKRLTLLPDSAPRVIQEWMINRPLKHIRKHQDSELLDILMQAAKKGIIVIVYSDYQVIEKLEAVEFTPSYYFTADEFDTLKPDASALIEALITRSIDPKQCLVIGDRYEKDGILAQNMGADYFILPSTKVKRKRCYQHSFSF